MAITHNIPITNGKGSKEIVVGNYNATADVQGYDSSTLMPTEVNIVDGVTQYNFTIEATGTLTLHVTDDGTNIGVPIKGATFIRCDADGKTYGNEVTSNVDGNAVFNNVPFSADDNITVYFKQTGSDGSHTFDNTLKNTVLNTQTATVEIENPEAALREFLITDKNYTNLPVSDGTLTLTAN